MKILLLLGGLAFPIYAAEPHFIVRFHIEKKDEVITRDYIVAKSNKEIEFGDARETRVITKETATATIQNPGFFVRGTLAPDSTAHLYRLTLPEMTYVSYSWESVVDNDGTTKWTPVTTRQRMKTERTLNVGQKIPIPMLKNLEAQTDSGMKSLAVELLVEQ
jgi:hypothetical protein